MAVLAGRMGRPVELPVGLLHATRAERVGAAAFVQVQLAHQAEIAQDLQRAVNSDQPQARLMDAAQCQQLCRGGLAAGLTQRFQHRASRARVRVTCPYYRGQQVICRTAFSQILIVAINFHMQSISLLRRAVKSGAREFPTPIPWP